MASLSIEELAEHTIANPAIGGFASGPEGHSLVISAADAGTGDVDIMDPLEGIADTWPYSVMKCCMPYGTWVFTDLITSYFPGPLHDFHCSTWGEIKALFAECGSETAVGTDLSSLQAGALEQRSCQYNRIPWREFADSSGFYNILRRTDDNDQYSTVKLKAFGDTVLIDSTAVPGHVYHYRVTSQEADTLKHTDEMPLGMQLTSELYFYDINCRYDNIVNGDTQYVATSSLMIPDDRYLYIAARGKIKKIDVSDPHNPVEVGSRDLSFLPEYFGSPQYVVDMQMGCYGTHLFVLTNGCLVAIDMRNNALPIVCTYDGFLPANSECYALAIKGSIAYIGAGGVNGTEIYAVSLSYPANLDLWGQYSGFGASSGLTPIAIESVGDYLYVEFLTGNNPSVTEILRPRVYEVSNEVSFDMVCSDHDSLICFPYSADLIGTDCLSKGAHHGNPTGYYSLGKSDDTTFVVYNTSSPTIPSIIETIEPRFSHSMSSPPFQLHISSYAFDDQYLYVGMWRPGGGRLWSPVYVFDIYSESSDPLYAVGDLMLGQDKCASVASWGKYLYYFDRARDDRSYYRLQVFEKARGCDPNLQVAIGPDPINDVYKIDQNVKISWNCVGCPTDIDMTLVEDGTTTRNIASLRKFNQGNLAANSIIWQARGISSPPEDHTYEIKIHARNIEGRHAECTSNSFSIVHHIQYGGKGPFPIVEVSFGGGQTASYPFPGFATQPSQQETLGYWILPKSPEVTDGRVSVTLNGCRGKQLVLTALGLLTVDAPNKYDLTLTNSGLELMAAGEDPVQLVPPGSTEEGAHGLAGGEEVVVNESRAMHAGERIEILGGNRRAFSFSMADKRSDATRHYVLLFSGLLVQLGDDEVKIPRVFALRDPCPNPFNPSTVIEFHVPEPARIELAVYNVAGALIAQLRDGSFMPGVYRVTWDGRDSVGSAVASGVYFCRLTIDGRMAMTKKLVILR